MEIQDKKYYLKVALILTLVLAVVAGVFYWLIRDAAKPATSVKTASQNKAVLPDPPSGGAEQKISWLYEIRKLEPMPKVASQQTIDQSVLPEEILALIPPASSGLVIQLVEFENNRSGYLIQYQTMVSVFDNQQYYRNLSQKVWSILDSAHIATAGLATMGNSQFDVAVEQFQASSTDSNTVTVRILQK